MVNAHVTAGGTSPGPFRTAAARTTRELKAMLAAHDLALAYTRVICAYWCGDSESLGEFEAWLARFWSDCPTMPSTNPTAVSPHFAAGHSLHWFETEAAILGYVPRKRGCYRIPRVAGLPVFVDHCHAVTGGPLAA